MAKLTVPIRIDALEKAKEYSKEFYDKGYQQGKEDENTKIIGFLKYHRYAIVDNNGDYYSIEELEDMLRGQSDENNV